MLLCVSLSLKPQVRDARTLEEPGKIFSSLQPSLRFVGLDTTALFLVALAKYHALAVTALEHEIERAQNEESGAAATTTTTTTTNGGHSETARVNRVSSAAKGHAPSARHQNRPTNASEIDSMNIGLHAGLGSGSASGSEEEMWRLLRLDKRFAVHPWRAHRHTRLADADEASAIDRLLAWRHRAGHGDGAGDRTSSQQSHLNGPKQQRPRRQRRRQSAPMGPLSFADSLRGAAEHKHDIVAREDAHTMLGFVEQV